MCWSTSSTCRACLKVSLQDFFEFGSPCYFAPNNVTFYEVFRFCTQLEITPEDGLSQRICCECVKDLQEVYNFLQRVLKNDKELKIIYSGSSGDKSDFTKDPLESITDAEDVTGEDVPINGLIENLVDHGEESSNEFLGNDNNDDNGFDDIARGVPLMSSPSDVSSKDDNDFLKSVETQIFPQGRFICKLCTKAYFTNTGLQAHMEIHTPKRKKHTAKESSAKTSIRNKSAKQINKELSNDSEDEVKEKNKDNARRSKKTFPCQVCGKQMISASKLRYHMVMHTGEKDYLCSMCPKAYSTIYALKHHMRAHTGERPYECKFCGDRFLRPTTLKSHMRRHTGERPYGCDICGKRFIQHSSMATHMKLNHMDKTLACPYCDKKYARQTDLNTHLLSHSGDKPFACKLCPSRFTRQSNLNKHMNQQHQSDDDNEGAIAERRKEFQDQKTQPSFDYSSTYTSNDAVLSLSKKSPSSCKPSASNSAQTFDSVKCIKYSRHTEFEKLVSPNNWIWPNQT